MKSWVVEASLGEVPMEARCPHCGGSQLIDAGVLPAAGGNLACRACDKEFWARAVPRANESSWKLRKSDGGQLVVSDMAALVELLRNGRASLEDEISRTGENWRRLAEIVELATVAAGVGAEGGDVVFGQGPQPGELDGPNMTLEVHPLQYAGGARSGGSKQSPGVSTRSLLIFLLALTIGGLSTVLIMRSQAERQARQNEVTRMLGQVSSLLHNGRRQDIASAVELVEHILLTAPENDEAKAWLAMARWTEADLSNFQALLLSESLALEPGEGVDQRGAARLSLMRELERTRMEEAFLTAQDVLKTVPESITANIVMAAYHWRQGAGEDYERYLTRLKVLDPNHWSRHYFEALSGSEDSAAALRAYQQLLVKEPAHNPVRLRFALSLWNQGELVRAREEVKLIEERASGHEAALALAGFFDRPVEELAQAIEPASEIEKRASELNQGEPAVTSQGDEPVAAKPAEESPKKRPLPLLLEEAVSLRAQGKTEQALGVYQRALARVPHNPDVLTGAAWCHFDLSAWTVAEDNFARALSQAPRYSEAHFGMAEVARVRGSLTRAKQFFSNYLDITPSGQRAELVRKRLAELEASSEEEAQDGR